MTDNTAHSGGPSVLDVDEGQVMPTTTGLLGAAWAQAQPASAPPAGPIGLPPAACVGPGEKRHCDEISLDAGLVVTRTEAG